MLFSYALADLVTCLDSKIPLKKKMLSRMVYRYTCSKCKVTCRGKTFRHFFTRAPEQMGTSNKTGKRIKNVKEPAISDTCCNVTPL